MLKSVKILRIFLQKTTSDTWRGKTCIVIIKDINRINELGKTIKMYFIFIFRTILHLEDIEKE